MDVFDATFVAGATEYHQLPPPMFAEIAFAGRSNVGKSSLINNLVARKKLVRTSSTPGCTRAINVFRLRLRGDAELDLVDLPGYGYAKRSKKERKAWGTLIDAFLTHRAGLRGVVIIVDVRRGPEEEDRQLLEYLEHLGVPAIVVATKTDKLPMNKRKLALQEVQRAAGRRVFGYSAVTGDGRERLWDFLLKTAAIETGAESEAEVDVGSAGAGAEAGAKVVAKASPNGSGGSGGSGSKGTNGSKGAKSAKSTPGTKKKNARAARGKRRG